MDKFIEFYNDEWDIDEAYTITDLGEQFGIDIRHARHYLIRMLDLGYLCHVKIGRNAYYMKRPWAKVFRQFEKVRVL